MEIRCHVQRTSRQIIHIGMFRRDNKFETLTNFIHEKYPQHTIEELWGCSYQQGDFTETHNHYGFDRLLFGLWIPVLLALR